MGGRTCGRGICHLLRASRRPYRHASAPPAHGRSRRTNRSRAQPDLPPRTALADAPATQRAWRAGELARFDVGCTVDGYWSDIGRTAVLGGPDGLQASRYAAILAGEQAQFDAARPGVTAAQVFDVAVTAVEGGGLRPYRRHHCGHGIGQSVYEAPIVSPGVDTPLAAGMTFCFETPYYEVGWGGMMVEDLVQVTETGVRVLTGSDRGLRVVPV